MKVSVSSNKAPGALGPYSQAIVVNGMVYTSGQLGMNAEGIFQGETAAEQAEQAIQNLKAVLEEAGSSIDNVVKTTVFLADINDFAAVNEVYGKHFTQPYPARSAVEVANLPKGGRVEIEVIATL
ncbi:MAG: RidA family protein [Cellulosilyticum sp.]|nr:RidA family protein [Cellulosilyticum sp.]